MNRRHFLMAAGCTALAPLARAHHGWSSFDQNVPLYLQGRVKAVQWQNPHVELDLELLPEMKLPANLASRAMPAQQAPVDGKALLAKAALPKRTDRTWHIELAPLTRMQAWSIEPIKEGETIELVGFTFPNQQGSAVLRAEFLFRGGKAFGLRSSPA